MKKPALGCLLPCAVVLGPSFTSCGGGNSPGPVVPTASFSASPAFLVTVAINGTDTTFTAGEATFGPGAAVGDGNSTRLPGGFGLVQVTGPTTVSASQDPAGDTVTCSWALVTMPAASMAHLSKLHARKMLAEHVLFASAGRRGLTRCAEVP